MDLMQAIQTRHSVRKYKDQPIANETLLALENFIDGCNRESGLSIRLCANEPNAFAGSMARYGRFEFVKNYIAIVGKKADIIEEKAGYFGEKIVLYAQQLGLNTCWAALTFKKSSAKDAISLQESDKLLMVIALGYGQTQGAAHKSKPLEKLYSAQGEIPDWFKKGVEAASLAPTAVNQQQFMFRLDKNHVKAMVTGLGFHTKVDLGIVKYHFEIGAGEGPWKWVGQP